MTINAISKYIIAYEGIKREALHLQQLANRLGSAPAILHAAREHQTAVQQRADTDNKGTKINFII